MHRAQMYAIRLTAAPERRIRSTASLQCAHTISTRTRTAPSTHRNNMPAARIRTSRPCAARSRAISSSYASAAAASLPDATCPNHRRHAHACDRCAHRCTLTDTALRTYSDTPAAEHHSPHACAHHRLRRRRKQLASRELACAALSRSYRSPTASRRPCHSRTSSSCLPPSTCCTHRRHALPFRPCVSRPMHPRNKRPPFAFASTASHHDVHALAYRVWHRRLAHRTIAHAPLVRCRSCIEERSRSI